MQRLGMVATVVATVCMVTPVEAQAPALGLKSLLGRASDGALTQLEKPGAFYGDETIRIALPGPLKALGGIAKFAEKTGLTGDLTRTMNDAAGIAAGAAKPVFRNAIDRMTLTDGLGIVTGGESAGTDYLQRSSGTVLHGQLRPIVESALRKTGALGQFDKLTRSGAGAVLGINSASFTDSVTEQTARGIFRYMAAEEANLRRNPLGIGKKILKGIRK